MPKGNKGKKKKARLGDDEGPGGLLNLPEDDSESICSSLDGSVLSDEAMLSEGGTDDTDSDSELQFQLTEHIDQLSDKNSHTRAAALLYLNKTLKQRVVSGHIQGREETLLDLLLRGVRKTRGRERCQLVQLISLVAVQLGLEYYHLFTDFKPTLIAVMKDHTVSVEERSAATSTVGFAWFFLCPDMPEIEAIMHEFEEVLGSCRSDGLVCSVLKGWTLLLSLLPPRVAAVILTSKLSLLNRVLSRTVDIAVRMSVGHSIALLFELVRDVDEDLLSTQEVDITHDLIRDLAAESNRYTARKERSQQRSCFRDLQHAVETGSVPERVVKCGLESVVLDSWAKLTQYGALTDLLANGMRIHLQHNELVRDVFHLGSPPVSHKLSRSDKIEKKLFNAAVAKHRTQSRSKQRDKRAVL